MLRYLLNSSTVKRVSHGVPVMGLLLVGQVTVLAASHLAKLDGTQRRRLLALLRQSRGRPGMLREGERSELAGLLAAMELRLFLGSAVRRLSPVPMPKRLLYGPRDSSARAALARRD